MPGYVVARDPAGHSRPDDRGSSEVVLSNEPSCGRCHSAADAGGNLWARVRGHRGNDRSGPTLSRRVAIRTSGARIGQATAVRGARTGGRSGRSRRFRDDSSLGGGRRSRCRLRGWGRHVDRWIRRGCLVGRSDHRDLGALRDRLTLSDEDRGQDALKRRRHFGVHLVSVDLEERLVPRNLVAWLLQPPADGPLGYAFSELGHRHPGHLLTSSGGQSRPWLVDWRPLAIATDRLVTRA